MPTQQVIFYGAIAFSAIAFLGFAWLFVSALKEGSGAYAKEMGKETSRQFEDLFIFIPPKKIADLGLFSAAAAFFVFFIPFLDFSSAASTVAGIVLGLFAGLFTFTLPGKYVNFLRERRKRKFEEQLVEALASMSNALRAGFSLTQAFEGVAKTGEVPISQEFNVLLQQLRIGMTFEDALTSLEQRINSDSLSLVCTSVDIARHTGGNLTEIFDRIADTIRARMRIENRIRTLTAQGRFQGIIVSLMPLGLGIILTIIKPGMMLPFLLSVKGAICCAIAMTLILCGWLIIRKIIRIEV